MGNILPANRIAAIAAFLTGLAAAVAGVANTLPQSWQSTVVAGVGVLGAIGTALHFMLGSQKHDMNQAQLTMKQLEIEHENAVSERYRLEDAAQNQTQGERVPIDRFVALEQAVANLIQNKTTGEQQKPPSEVGPAQNA
jgi:hypothetical protein